MSILKDLNIPHMGSVENARFLNWLIAEGDSFNKGDALYEVETDKTVTEVEADESGILVRQLASEGDEFKVSDRIGLHVAVGTSDDAIETALAGFSDTKKADAANHEQTTSAASPVTESTAQLETPPPASSMKLSPRVRRLLREHPQIDPNSIEGTGPKGRIVGEDVLAMVEAQASAVSSEPPASIPVPTNAQTAQSYSGEVPHKRVENSLRRKTIARRLSEINHAAPMLTADMDIDLTALLSMRQRYKSAGQTAPSVLSYFASATAELLNGSHQALNARYEDNETLLWQTVNINIAMDTEEGLVTPVIHNAQSLSPAVISAGIADLAAKARNGSVQNKDMEGGTFTISNPGSLGPVVRAEAILNGPQVALLGLAGMIKKPVVITGPDGTDSIAIRTILRASLTFDHRGLDGGDAIRFLNDLRARIESAW